MEVQIISLIIALLAVIVGPFAVNWQNKKNHEFQFRTLVQERWVEKLEKDAYAFLNSILEWIEKYRGIMDGSANVDNPNKEIDRMFNAVNSSFIKLNLLLDSSKPAQIDILVNMIRIKDIVNKKLFDEESILMLRESYDIIVDRVKTVLQIERSKMTKIFK